MNEKNIESLVHNGTLLFSEAASDFTSGVDWLFYFILAVSTVIFLIILVIGGWFLVKYKKSKTNLRASGQMVHFPLLEVSWTLGSFVILMFIFFVGYKDYLSMTVAPPGSMEVHASAKKWLWNFRYPSGVQTINELVVPVDTPVKLLMSSEDVVHSFYLPNLRVKKDVYPNRYTYVWFQANRTGNFQVFCTEYCGDGHSDMTAVLRVLEKDDYEKWLINGNSTDDISIDKLGQQLYVSKGCNACHTVDGGNSVGPTWKGLFGSMRSFSGGTVLADENYIRESIVEPNAKVLTGFSPVMPTYSGMLSDREIDAIIYYIKNLEK